MTERDEGCLLDAYGKPIPITEVIKALSSLEESWGDYVEGLLPRSKGRKAYCGLTQRKILNVLGWKQVHTILNTYHEMYEKGERSAAWQALVFCSQQNIPMPYWLSESIQKISKRVLFDGEKITSLHQEFGMERIAPIKNNKNSKKRREKNLMRMKIYGEVVNSMQDRGSPKVDPALNDALGVIENIDKTTARALYKEQEALQAPYIKAFEK